MVFDVSATVLFLIAVNCAAADWVAVGFEVAAEDPLEGLTIPIL